MTITSTHVALDIGPLYGHRTGVGVATEALADALDRRDDIRLLPYLVSFRAETADGHRKLPLPGVAASHLWSRFDRPHADRWLPGAEVVHGTNYVAPPTRLPTVVSVYDCWFLRHPQQATALVRRAGQNLRRAVARGAHVHVSSHATASEAAELLETERITVVHLGPPAPVPPSDELATPEFGHELSLRPFVLAVGTEERRKGLPMLIEAFRRLAAAQPDPILVIAGATGDQSADVGAAIAAVEPAVRDRIHRLGPVEQATKYWLLRHAAALAYPSIDEGFGFPVLEAQLAGTPVVATAVGSIPEVAGDAAELVSEHDPEPFSAALERVLTDGGLRLGLIESGHRNAHRFSWATTADGIVDLYHRAKETT